MLRIDRTSLIDYAVWCSHNTRGQRTVLRDSAARKPPEATKILTTRTATHKLRARTTQQYKCTITTKTRRRTCRWPQRQITYRRMYLLVLGRFKTLVEDDFALTPALCHYRPLSQVRHCNNNNNKNTGSACTVHAVAGANEISWKICRL